MNQPVQPQIVAGQAMRKALHEAGSRPLLLNHRGQQRTGIELAARIDRLAGALAAHGLGGRRIGLAYRNSLAAFEAFLAVEWLGATRVPVDPDLPPAEARAIYAAAAVDAVLADEEHGAHMSEALMHDDDNPLQGDPWGKEFSIPADTTFITYPRQVAGGELFAVHTSYGNWDAIMRINCELYRTGLYGQPLESDEVGLTVQQLMHGTGMLLSFPFLQMGLPQVVLPRFDGETMLETIHEHRITAFFGVPGMLTRLADCPNATERAGTLRHSLYGGAPLGLDELRRVRRILGPSLVQVYGRFEAGWPLAVLGPQEHAEILAGNDELGGSCGRLIPQIEARLTQVRNRPPGHGELQTRSAMTAPAYADPEGWCSLGDVAYRDARGYLYLAGRLDQMINTGSYHVYPGQVEEAIAADAGVAAVKVAGEPHPVWGQAVTAYIVPHDLSTWHALVERLRTELPSRLARYKIPKAFRPVEKLPEDRGSEDENA